MVYVKKVWVDVPEGTVPPVGAPLLDAANLDHIEQGIVDEETGRVAGDLANSTAVTAEAVTARAAETANASAITAEAATARAAETAKLAKASNLSDVADPGTSKLNLKVPVLVSVRAVATANVALTGLQTVDTVVLADGAQVLLAGQSTASQNGPWVAHSGAWTRPTDFAGGAALTHGRTILVTGGSAANAGAVWALTATLPCTIDTTAQTWKLASSAVSSVAGRTGAVTLAEADVSGLVAHLAALSRTTRVAKRMLFR